MFLAWRFEGLHRSVVLMTVNPFGAFVVSASEVGTLLLPGTRLFAK